VITLIAARARNGAIGRDNTIPWNIPADFRMFQRETLGGAVIMGRRTWESLPVRPLKNRYNIVVSGDAHLDIAATVVPSVAAALDAAKTAGYTRVYGIGGAGIYAALLPFAHRLLLTEIDTTIPDADTFFPAVDMAEWYSASSMAIEAFPPARVQESLRISSPAG